MVNVVAKHISFHENPEIISLTIPFFTRSR